VEAAAQRYFRTVRLICNGLLGLAALVLVLEIWGVSISWLLTSPLGSQILTRVLLMALTVGGTAVVIQISKALTEYLILPRTTAQGIIREPSRKLKTLVPLMQTLIRAGAVFAAVLVILEQLNVATGPILAGVGIFGLAVGFASQSLIKDVINGLFILFEDSLSVGDVVTLRGIGGQVEKVTLRAVTIRDLSGNVHVIPNSTIDMITNMTKEYSRYVLDVAVSYREDADAVVAILREIDEAIRRDPAYGRDMLEPLEIMGLDRFEESAIVIRARLKTRPLQQWRIGREFNRRIKKVFDERGIEIPFPHRTLYWGTPKDGAPPPLRVTVEQEQPVRQEDAC
jgi:small conductance mechanosensitive channel